MIGQTVSHYRILEPLGEGGMGTVYLAEDTHLGRRVAIKFPSLGSDTHDYRARFLREARAISELSHPRIATLFDYGQTEEGRPFLVMEFARGQTLAQLLKNDEVSMSRAVDIVIDVATALTEAHARGVVHRDIKPSNIIIDERGQIKVLDFGLAKQLNKDLIISSQPEAPTLLSTETRSGIVLGTPAYLSPEQAMGQDVDGRSDLFALGVILYEAITGRTPFSGAGFIEIAANVLHLEPPAPSKVNSQVPRELDVVTLKALAKKPAKRYQSAEELIGDLQSIKDRLDLTTNQTVIRRSIGPGASLTLSNLSQILQRPRIPISYALIVVGLVVVVGLAAWLWFRPKPHQPTAEAQRWYNVGTDALRDGAYYQASKAFERAIAADDAYMLAHGRLADALVELDYMDRAKDELLRVNSTDKSAMPQAEVLSLDATTATAMRDYGKAVSLYSQIAQQAPEAEKAYALVDLGRAHDKNNDPKKAIEAYTEASNLSTQYPTPYLHLGILYGRQQELASSLAAFQKAEGIYQALGSLEGRAEVLFQRGALNNKLNKLTEAKSQLEQALTLAKAGDNKSQEIKTLLQLSSVEGDLGNTQKSTQHVSQAMELAQTHGLENLSARSLNDQGNNSMIKGEYNEADRYFGEALASAQRSKALSNEARARASLASLRLQQNNADEALNFLKPALSYYQQGGYRSETFTCLTLLARANRQKGDYETALKANEELLQLAEQGNDQSQIALAQTELGNVLTRQQKFPEALDRFNKAHAIYASQGIQRSIGFNLEARAYIQGQLGHYQESQSLLNEATSIADKPNSGFKRLSIDLKVVAAELALNQGNATEARSKAESVITIATPEFPDLACIAKRVSGLAHAYGGSAAIGKQRAAESLEIARKLNDPDQIAASQLALSEALLISGDSQGALNNALQAHEIFSRLGQVASEWRALVVAAKASQNLGDKTKAREYALRATDSLSRLPQRLGSETDSYLGRPDIQRLKKQLNELTSSAA